MNAELKAIKEQIQGLVEQVESHQEANTPRPIAEWHEDYGDCLWWFFPIEQAPYCGNPLDARFPDYVTHFTLLTLPITA